MRSGFDGRRHIRLRGHPERLPAGRLRRHRGSGRGQEPVHRGRPYKVPNVRITARSILSNTTPAMAFRGFGTPQVNWAVESNIDAAARALGIDRAEIRLRNLATRGEEVVPDDTPADGLWPETVEKAMDMIGWDEPLPDRSRAGPRGGHQVERHDRALVLDRAAAGRRQRAGLRRHQRHGPGCAHDLRPDRGQRDGRADRHGQRDHGRHRRRALRPADLGQPLDRLHGQRHHACLPRHPGPGGRPWPRAAESVPRDQIVGRPGRGRPARRGRSADGRCRPGRPGQARWRDHRQRACIARRSSPIIRSAAARPSTSSTAPRSSCRWTRRPATSPSTSTSSWATPASR